MPRVSRSVDPYLAVLQRSYEIVGGVHEGEEVAAVPPAHEVGDRDERLQGAVARAGALAREGGVDTGHAVLDGDDRVGHAQSEVVVGMVPNSVAGSRGSR